MSHIQIYHIYEYEVIWTGADQVPVTEVIESAYITVPMVKAQMRNMLRDRGVNAKDITITSVKCVKDTRIVRK